MRIALAAAVAAVSMLLAGCGEQSRVASPASSTSSATDAGEASSPVTPSESGSSATRKPKPRKPSPSQIPPPRFPACADIWVVGKKLPVNYRGCRDGSRRVPARDYFCAFGYPIVTFGDRYYAVTGYRISQVPSLRTSKQFKRALTNCSG